MAGFNLDLIRVFLAIYENESLTKAANQLLVTQPSVSYSLSRLRHELSDALFVRTSSGMVPTTRADELHAVFSRAVESIEKVLARDDFDPSSSKATFRLALSDIGEYAFLPPLMAELALLAPGVEINVVQLDADAVGDWLAKGAVDAAITSLTRPAPGDCAVLFTDSYVCVTPQSYGPRLSTLSATQFSKLRHVAVHPTSGHSQVDEEIAREGLERRVALRVPHFSALPDVIAKGNLAAIIPRRIAVTLPVAWDLGIHELPLELEPFNVSLLHPPLMSLTPARKWFLSTVMQSVKHFAERTKAV